MKTRTFRNGIATIVATVAMVWMATVSLPAQLLEKTSGGVSVSIVTSARSKGAVPISRPVPKLVQINTNLPPLTGFTGDGPRSGFVTTRMVSVT